MFTEAYLQTATHLVQTYGGGEPFHLYLKNFFAQHKKYGARDRRYIAQLCYCWFRAAHALQHLDAKRQLTYALFLCSDGESKLLEGLNAALYAQAEKGLDEKIELVSKLVGFQLQQLFPWITELSPEIETTPFLKSLLVQPNLYLRVRPGKGQPVTTALRQNNIAFESVSEHCLAISNSAKVDAVVNLDADAVVQDLNSQKVLDLLLEHGVLKKFRAWDCCAASGGKSLLLLDTFSAVRLTVSDVRESILHNLQKRFKMAGINGYRWFVGDAAKKAPPHAEKFDVIICDAPCSGSGTWSRTPEQLHHFPFQKIDEYATLQKSIVANVCRYLKPGGLLIYSTCSVFTKENEAVADYISKSTPVNFLKSAYYKGYDKKADTLYAASFKAS